MSKRNERIERQRTEVSKRLKEILAEKHMKQATLRRETASRYGIKITAPQLSQIINGYRTLQPDFCRMFSNILEIDPGYLLGTDDFKADNYLDFLRFYGPEATEAKEREKRKEHKYDLLFQLTGYTNYGLDHEYTEELTDSGEHIFLVEDYYYVEDKKGQLAYIPIEELERLNNNIVFLATEMIRPLMRIFKTVPPVWY